MRFIEFDELKSKMVVLCIAHDENSWSEKDPRGWCGIVRCVKQLLEDGVVYNGFPGPKRAVLDDFENKYSECVIWQDGDKIRVWDLYDKTEMRLVLLMEECPDLLPIEYSVTCRSPEGFSATVWKPAWIFGMGTTGPKAGERVTQHYPELEFDLDEEEE